MAIQKGYQFPAVGVCLITNMSLHVTKVSSALNVKTQSSLFKLSFLEISFNMN